MADRRDYYYRQKVTEAELDAGFEGLEQADFNLSVDHALFGIADGMVVSEKSGTPDLSVDVSGGTSYSKQGERINFSATQNVDVSQDDGGTPTTVSTPGNTKVVSVFVEFDRTLSDPRIDGNSLTVYHQRAESFDFSVVQGAEATIGSEVAPSLDANKILLADIRIENGTTQILDSATVGAYDQIDFSRTEYVFRVGAGKIPVVAGNASDAMDGLIDEIDDHINGVSYKHDDADITVSVSNTWRNLDTIVATDLHAALEEIVGELAGLGGSDRVGSAQLSYTWDDAHTIAGGSILEQLNAIVQDIGGVSGSDRIGSALLGQTWEDGHTVSTGSIYDQLNAIVADLATTVGSGGAARLGSGAISQSPESLSAGDIFGQLTSLLTYINARAPLASPTFTGTVGVDGVLQLLRDDDEADLVADKLLIDSATVSFERALLCRLKIPSAHDVLLYVEKNGFSIAVNCEYDGSVWSQIDTSVNSFYWDFTSGQFKLLRKDIGSSVDWSDSDSSWDDISMRYYFSPTSSNSEIKYKDGVLIFDGATTGKSNIAQGTDPEPNSLYAKNICKAWGYVSIDGSGNILTAEGFNFDTPSNIPTGNGLTITFGISLDDGNYAVVPSNLSGGNEFEVVASMSNTSFTLNRYDTSGSLLNRQRVHQVGFVVYGTDSTP